MAKCPHCGAEVGEELSFCPGCGKYVQPEPSKPALDHDKDAPITARVGRFNFKVPKKSILLAVAFILVGGIFGFVREYRQASEPSSEDFQSACVKECLPTQQGLVPEFCDCFCRALQEHASAENYSADEMKAFLESTTLNEAWSDTKLRELVVSCAADWTGREYPDFFRQEFLQGCLEVPDRGQDFCQCYLKQVEQRYSLSEIIEVSLKMQQNPALVPPGLADAVTACQ